MRYITLTAHLVAFTWQLPIYATHTAERGCLCFSDFADECTDLAAAVALRSIMPKVHIMVVTRD